MIYVLFRSQGVNLNQLVKIVHQKTSYEMENEQDSDNEFEMVKEKLGQGLLINKVPIHRGLKLPMKKALRIRKDIYPAEPEIVITEYSQITEIESQPQLEEPGEKLTIIERAVGYFNAENDEEASKSALNTSVVRGPPFSCIICKSWFYLGTKLKVHYILNHKMYHCEVCSSLFQTHEDKETHLRDFHSQSFCEICQKNIVNCYNLVEHYEYDHNSTTCKFCGTLLQPKTMFTTHVLRKHCVNNKFLETPDVKFMNVLDNDSEFFCALCDKNRESEGFFGHMNSHHKISVTSLLNMMIKERVEFKVDGAKLSDRKNGAKEEILPLSYKIKGHRNTCSVCFIRFTKKMPSGFHAVYCQSRIHCKYCNTRFENVTLRDKHVQKRHNKFFCTLGCEKLSFNSEENLNKHYLTYHEIISCRYCEVFISVNNGKYESHLMESHKYKAVIMKNFTDTLFEVTDQKDKHIVVCCLCDENITLLVETVRDIYDHYSIIHSVSAKRILQLVTPKPILAEYEDFYREINESIKKESQENEAISSDETSDVHNNGRQDGGDVTADQSDLSLNSIANIKIKMEPLDLPSEEENVQESSFDESKFETDFDYQELEGLLQYDSGSDDEDEVDKSICELCGQEEISLLDLMIHLKNDHKLKSQYCEYRCDYCSELFLNKMSYMNHLFSHQETSELDVSKDTLNCDCDSKVFVNLARSHILKSHVGDLDKYDVQQLGLKCRFCELRFWEYEEANEHEVKMHLDENAKAFLKCYKCLTIFSNQICLKQHTKQLHQDSIPYTNFIYKCLQCSVASPNIELSREHFHSVHPDSKIYLCPVPNCHKTCSHPKYIKIHLKTPHKSKAKVSAKPDPCDVCGKVSKSLRAASIHKLMKHNRDRAGFQCRICRERFNTNEQRKLHYATSHTGQLAYTCLECGKGFVSKSGLYGHKKIHEQATVQVCPYCSKEFIRRDSYNEHLLIHIGPRHQCPHCPKSFTQRSNLTRHVRIHTGVKPYSCMYCDKRFSDQGACRSHERVHTKEEHCECSYCGKKFSKRQKLKYHIKFHTGEGLMDCEVCGKQFTNSYSLTEHRKIHNQQTLVMCKCGRGFTSEKYLHRHMINVHSQGPARYFCPICYKPIYHRSAYNDHVMTHTSVKHVKCLLCNTEYNTRKTVRKHLLEKHNFKPTDDFSAHIYQLTPEEAGLNIPPVTELTDLLEDQNILKIDISQLQTMDAGSKSMSAKKKPRKDGAKLQIKEELVTDDEAEDNDESEDEVMLETRAKRKVKKPVKLRQKSEINTKNMKNDDDEGDDISEDVSMEENV